MKISTTSLICGSALIIAPIVHNLLIVAMVAYVLASRPEKDVNLSGSLNESYPYWCLFFGACLIVTGIVFALRRSA